MRLLLVAAILFSDIHCFATPCPSYITSDTIIERTSAALTQNEFLQKYGRDDSSRALINFFFAKRKWGQHMVGGGSILLLISTAGLVAPVAFANKSDHFGDPLGSALLIILIGSVLGEGVATASAGTGLWMRYSRKRMLKLLDKYFTGKNISRGIAGNRMFRGYVQYGQWNRDINKKMKTVERNRKIEQRRAG